ncbi:hypothetical protein [Flexivirga sp.]|uniref:hypothetical protein n=1 Tax=Flexivirga sp. TaxID=1962927 RepID=UPI003F80299A
MDDRLDYLPSRTASAPARTTTFSAARAHRSQLTSTEAAYKQLVAPTGTFAMHMLKASTAGVRSVSASETSYTRTENTLRALGSDRDTLGQQLAAVILGANEAHGAQSVGRLADLTSSAARWEVGAGAMG